MNTFVDMHVDSANTNNIYVATNSIDVLHATCINNRTNPLMYKPAEISEWWFYIPSNVIAKTTDLSIMLNITGECGGSTCIDVCPFSQSFFWVRFF